MVTGFYLLLRLVKLMRGSIHFFGFAKRIVRNGFRFVFGRIFFVRNGVCYISSFIIVCILFGYQVRPVIGETKKVNNDASDQER